MVSIRALWGLKQINCLIEIEEQFWSCIWRWKCLNVCYYSTPLWEREVFVDE